jgi:hypothetical protein
MLRKCCFVVLSIFLQAEGTTPQVVAASMVLVAALSLQLQYRPFVDNDHDFLESIGLHACLVQLLVALLCNSIGKIDSNTLGAVSTTVLIVTMFGSSLFFFGWTTRMTIQSSQEADGAIGMLAKVCGSCCGTKGNGKTEKAKNSQQQSVLVRVTPRSAQRDGSETGEEEYSRVQVNDSQQHNQVVLKEAEQEVQQIRKASELARRKTIDRVRQQEEKADARVQKRLALRKKATQMGALQK